MRSARTSDQPVVMLKGEFVYEAWACARDLAMVGRRVVEH